MARATHVQRSRKKIPESKCGIEGGIPKGSSYYWWKFRRGGKHYSLTPPKPSQLTQSSFWSTVFSITEAIEETDLDKDSLESARDSAVEELRNLADECQSSYDNMPEGLQQGDTGQLLESRVEACNEKADEFEAIDIDDPEDDADEDEHWSGIKDELLGVDLSTMGD